VDDHEIVREGLESLLALEPDLDVVGSVSSGPEALAVCEGENAPHVVLLDLRMPGMDGFEVLARLREKHPDVRVLVLSSQDGDEAIFRALEAGAAGYLLKKTKRAELADAIRKAMKGSIKPTGEVARRLAERERSSPLSPREVEILSHVARGARNKDIGATLGISESTVKNHMNTILIKLGADDRTEAVTLGLQRGIIDINK
jgi:DNA-binding NarL/FixJ family response regulator